MHLRLPRPALPLTLSLARTGETVCELPIDRLPDPVIALDGRGRVTDLNSAVRRVLKGVFGALEGRGLNELVPGMEPSILKSEFATDAAGPHHFDVALGTGPDATQYEGTVMELLSFGSEAPGRHFTETIELVAGQLGRLMEREWARLEIEKAFEQAQHASQSKSEFVANRKLSWTSWPAEQHGRPIGVLTRGTAESLRVRVPGVPGAGFRGDVLTSDVS